MNRVYQMSLWTLSLLLLSTCSSRGWQLSQQLEGYDDNLNPIELASPLNSEKDTRASPTGRVLASENSLNVNFSSNPIVPTLMGEEGILLQSK